MAKNYSGSDLSNEFKAWFRKEKSRLLKIFAIFGITNVEMSYGFYYFSGFFTAPNGQIYYFSCSDVRHFGYKNLLIRTAKSYKDFTGGSNQYASVDTEELKAFLANTIR